MFRTIDEYLAQLKIELKGSDRALVQDALADSEEFLYMSLEKDRTENPEHTNKEALNSIIAKYGTPTEVAGGYLELEVWLQPGQEAARPAELKSFWSRIFGVFAEPRAWGAFLYLILTALTGLVYTAWIIIGGLFSLTSLLLIIGIPIAAVFILSFRGLALIEGRITEALLGERMPRKPLFVQQELKWTEKLKALFSDSQTWKTFVYMLLLFPLGIVYFLLFAGLFVLSLSFISSPVMELVFHAPLELVGTETFTPVWLLPLVCVVGFFMLPLTLHLAKFVGKLHGRYAKAMLVRK